MLIVIMQSAVLQSFTNQIVVMLNVALPNTVMLSVALLDIIMLRVLLCSMLNTVELLYRILFVMLSIAISDACFSQFCNAMYCYAECCSTGFHDYDGSSKKPVGPDEQIFIQYCALYD